MTASKARWHHMVAHMHSACHLWATTPTTIQPHRNSALALASTQLTISRRLAASPRRPTRSRTSRSMVKVSSQHLHDYHYRRAALTLFSSQRRSDPLEVLLGFCTTSMVALWSMCISRHALSTMGLEVMFGSPAALFWVSLLSDI